MIKLLSVKTRRADTTRDAFRRHYEERHVPLGLGFIEQFRWCKYVRNHVLDVASGSVDFDCLTEFGFATRADQESTARFAATPAFRVLDEDDRRFLDVDRRLACELDESLLAGERPAIDPPGARRMAALFALPPDRASAGGARTFVDGIERDARALASASSGQAVRVTFDRRVSGGPRPERFAAIVSLWTPPGRPPAALRWKGETEPEAIVLLDVVETPPERLYRTDALRAEDAEEARTRDERSGER